MAIISSKAPASKSSSVELKMKNALGVFTKALSDLVKVRDEANNHYVDVQVQITSLEEEKEKLSAHIKVIDSKIDKVRDLVE